MRTLPGPYLRFIDRFPEVHEKYAELARKCHEWGPLDARTRRLVKLGMAIGASLEGAVKSHTRRALEEGVTPDEIRHACLMGLTTVGFPAMIGAAEWMDEVFETVERSQAD